MKAAAKTALAVAVAMLAFAAVIVLAACGGGSRAPASSQPQASASSQPQAQQDPQAAAWVAVMREDWSRLSAGGSITPAPISCPADGSDPVGSHMGRIAPAPGARWAYFGGHAGSAAELSVSGGMLRVDSLQGPGKPGMALIGAETLPRSAGLRLQVSIDLEPSPGAWISAPLLVNEGDYRQISLRAVGDRIHADVGAPCYWAPLANYPRGLRSIAIEYVPEGEVCWRYFVDGAALHEERCDHKRAALDGDPRAAIYVVNVGVESGVQAEGVVRADVGPIEVLTRR